MKNLLPIILLAIPLTAAEVTMIWDYPEDEVADVERWRLYHSENLVEPSNFTFHSDYPVGPTNQITLDIIPGQHYFFLTASNFWTDGENMFGANSEPSNILRTPHVLTNGATLYIMRGRP